MDAVSRPEQRPLTKTEINWIFVGLIMAMLLASLDQTIVATAMPTIGRELGDLEHLPWIVTAYLLAATAATPLAGKLSDIHGRSIVLSTAIGIFLIGSVACALAPSLPFLALARGLQGLGGGALISLAQTIIGDVVTPRERANYQVYIASVFMCASLSGPVLGGYFAQHWHWSFIFWINIPFGLAALAMTRHFLRRLPRHERKHQLDILGAVLLVVATTTLLLGLSSLGRRMAFSPLTLELLFAGSLLAWALLVWRLRTAAEPLIPISVLANSVVLRATLGAALSMGLFIALSIYMPLYFEEILHLTASQSGLALLPFMAGTVVGSTISGRTMVLIVHYKYVPLCGLGLAFCAVLTLAFHPVGFPLWGLAILLGLTSAGLGTVLTIATVSVQNMVPYHQLGTATASMNLCRQLSGALLVAIFGTIVIGTGNVAGTGLEGRLLQPEEAGQLVAAYRLVFSLSALGILSSFLALLHMEERPLTGSKAFVDATVPGE
jgi:EmrB/QacA subfamily drug resistance transporter